VFGGVFMGIEGVLGGQLLVSLLTRLLKGYCGGY
jgi:hypothetical protein